jgi:hypothetical protein
MSLRPLAVLVLALAPVAAHAADEENPFKNAKVGDFAKYDTLLKTGGAEVKGTRVQTVTAVGDKELSLKTVTEALGKEVPNKRPDQKIDLTKPFDTTADDFTGGSIKWEKLKDGQEKVKVNGKEYECTWTTYKPVVPGKADLAVTGEMKVWKCKEVPFVVKRTLTLKFNENELSYTTELTEFGSKK